MAKDKDMALAESADKLKAFTSTVAAIESLPRPDRLDVLRAVANFYGLVVPMEAPR
jgi:hypothetical protein